jgi:hypothetical protein
MTRKHILTVAVWFFLVLNSRGGGLTRRGPFPDKIKCETYRMRVSHYQPTSSCIQPAAKKK